MSENNNEVQKKEAVTKTFAIVGLIVVLFAGGFLAVKIVTMIPGAFGSLASLADGVYNYSEEPSKITVSVGDSVVASGDTLNITWASLNKSGEYYFVYECVEGVSMVSVDDNNPLSCDDLIPVSGGILSVLPSSEKVRFADVPFTILYIRDDESETMTDSVVTVFNSNLLSESISTIELSEPDVVVEDESKGDAVTEVVEVNPVSPAPTPSNPVTVPEFEFITKIPQNDPNGYTDLAVRYLGVGIIENQTFEPKVEIKSDDSGAIQFEVKNLGTKTSSEWNFVANLPNGIEYDSPSQSPLRPNEKAILTIGFTTDEITGTKMFSVEVNLDEEVNTSNNYFQWSVKTVK